MDIIKQNDNKYQNLKDFIDNAPINDQIDLWKKIVNSIESLFKNKNISSIYISSNGYDVPYLHIQLDCYPKTSKLNGGYDNNMNDFTDLFIPNYYYVGGFGPPGGAAALPDFDAPALPNYQDIGDIEPPGGAALPGLFRYFEKKKKNEDKRITRNLLGLKQ